MEGSDLVCDALFFNGVLEIAIRRFGGKLIDTRTLTAMREGATIIEEAYRSARPSEKPREVPPVKAPLPMVPQ